MTQYYPRDVIKHFGISSETARQWAKEFARHLSPLGSPEEKRHRVYSETDMRIFALVAQMKSANFTYREIHVSLDNGQLGDFVPNDESELMVSSGAIAALQGEVTRLQAQINRLEGENNLLKNMLEEKEEQLFEARHRLKILTDGKGD